MTAWAVLEVLTCYECGRVVSWLAPDSRCVYCTRVLPEELA